MKVFIVFEKYDPYDDDDLIGVYSTLAKAEQVQEKAPNNRIVIEQEVE